MKGYELAGLLFAYENPRTILSNCAFLLNGSTPKFDAGLGANRFFSKLEERICVLTAKIV
jgi:hypothetical protein